ncbi:MAG: DUF2062 domain-containing protein [Chromatiales bacterium]|nr:DUF2062 domain-containing protein [Chromatiales bacterium]
MAKHLLKKLFPGYHAVREHKSLRFFGTLLHDPNLWHLNRRSAAGAFAVGLFFAFQPVPFQMLFSSAVAIMARVNLPISVILVWITNPLTMGPIYFACYKLGERLLGTRHGPFHFEPSLSWITTEMLTIWKPFLLGCFVTSIVTAIVGYLGIHLLWRLHIVRRLSERRRRSRNA